MKAPECDGTVGESVTDNQFTWNPFLNLSLWVHETLDKSVCYKKKKSTWLVCVFGWTVGVSTSYVLFSGELVTTDWLTVCCPRAHWHSRAALGFLPLALLQTVTAAAAASRLPPHSTLKTGGRESVSATNPMRSANGYCLPHHTRQEISSLSSVVRITTTFWSQFTIHWPFGLSQDLNGNSSLFSTTVSTVTRCHIILWIY